MSLPQPGKRTIVLAILAILVTVTVLVVRRPYYNWDMFPYMAIAIGQESVPFDSTHREVYRIARATLPPADFEAISARQPDLMNDAAAFEGILKYYTIKPGYNLIVAGFCALGINPVTATALPSAVSYFLLGCLVLFWTLRTGPAGPGGLFTLVIVLAPSLIDLARYSSPDMLCAMISVVGFVLIFQGRPAHGLFFLLGALTIRPDAVILLVLIAAALALSGSVRWSVATAMAVFGCLNIMSLFNRVSGLDEYLLLSDDVGMRWSAYYQGLGPLLHSYTLPAMGLAIWVLYLRKGLHQSKSLSLFIWAALASMVIRYMAHPFVEDRFHLPAYLLILLVFWDTLVARLYPRQQTNR